MVGRNVFSISHVHVDNTSELCVHGEACVQGAFFYK